MEDVQERPRAVAVITALLNEDIQLARNLIIDDPDPYGLAWGALTIAAGMWEQRSSIMGRDPIETWAASLLSKKDRS